MKRFLTVAFYAGIAALCAYSTTFSSLAFAENGFVSLSPTESAKWTEDGKAAAGWVKYGGEATFETVGDAIVGKRGPGYSTFLCTEKKYSNFIFKCETKIDVDVNSGIQFRSNTRPGKWENKDVSIVFGYQCESTLHPEHRNAFVYDEGRRGRWINADTPELIEKSAAAFKKDEWNEYTIQCVGPSIKTWLNGTLVSDFIDLESSDGFIALQMHVAPQGEVQWRNIRIKELPATPWVPLYANGKFGDLESKCLWEQIDGDSPFGSFVPKSIAVNKVLPDGTLSSSTPPNQKEDGILVSKKNYQDFAVKVSFKMESGNSGLYFRAKENDQSYWLSGFQCEIAMDSKVNAALWEVAGRGWVGKTQQTEAVSAKATKQGDWNNIATVAVGDHIVTFLNGETVMNLIDPKPTHGSSGKVGLQLHGGGSQGCLFRDFYIMPLNEEAVKLINAK
ncbi:MAG: DUF1080 domain-containing protein [Planctomycetaceae bacterium]|jgi:hypothetical protein|nr:DUF1080 domain-containing protein [Planctomycetaceae bacterium]